jgi:hypothetical protein
VRRLYQKWRARRMALAVAQIEAGRDVADVFDGDKLGFRAGLGHASGNAERRLGHARSHTEWTGD